MIFTENGKVLVIRPTGNYEFEDIEIREIKSIEELTVLIADDFVFNQAAVENLLENENFVDVLDRLGYRNVKKLKEISDKIVVKDRYYFYDNSRRYGSYSLEEVNLDRLTDYGAEKLAGKEVFLFREVDKSSLKEINEKAYRTMQAAKKRITEEENKKKVTAAARAARKKEKELEQARVMLIEAGELKE